MTVPTATVVAPDPRLLCVLTLSAAQLQHRDSAARSAAPIEHSRRAAGSTRDVEGLTEATRVRRTMLPGQCRAPSCHARGGGVPAAPGRRFRAHGPSGTAPVALQLLLPPGRSRHASRALARHSRRAAALACAATAAPVRPLRARILHDWPTLTRSLQAGDALEQGKRVYASGERAAALKLFESALRTMARACELLSAGCDCLPLHADRPSHRTRPRSSDESCYTAAVAATRPSETWTTRGCVSEVRRCSSASLLTPRHAHSSWLPAIFAARRH